jgi:hypothetical protein
MRVTGADSLVVCGRALGGAAPQLHSDLHSSEDAAVGSACHALAESWSVTRSEGLPWTAIVSILWRDP